MTATDPIYASTSALPPPDLLNQHFGDLGNSQQFLGQQFQLPIQDSDIHLQQQIPGSSQQQVLHIRASDGSQVQTVDEVVGDVDQSGKVQSEIQDLYNCTVCELPIRDRYLYKVLENSFHEACLKCADCKQPFQQSCYSKQGRIYCRDHFFRKFGPKCSRCSEVIGEKDVVRKANGHVYHLECFKCIICEKELSTGDQFYLIPMDGRLVCRADYENSTKEAEMDCGNKRPRTTISAKSLETLKQAYQASSKPARHVREQLAAETGLDMRVVQVWFQNRRAKEKRLKKDAGRRWPNSALFNRTIDSDSSNDESLTGRSPLYGTATFMENSSDMEMHSEIGYGDYFGSAWTPLSRYSSEEHNYMNNDPGMNIGGAGMMGLPPPAPMHSTLDHNIYGDLNGSNPIQIPHSMASVMAGCGLAQNQSILPPYHISAPQHMPMMTHPIGINDLPPYSH